MRSSAHSYVGFLLFHPPFMVDCICKKRPSPLLFTRLAQSFMLHVGRSLTQCSVLGIERMQIDHLDTTIYIQLQTTIIYLLLLMLFRLQVFGAYPSCLPLGQLTFTCRSVNSGRKLELAERAQGLIP